MTTFLRHAVRIAAISLAGVLGLAANAQTNITTGGAEIRAFFARNATTVYAAAYGGGLHLSTDTGASFSRVAMPNNERYLTSLAGTASLMVIGAEEGLLRTTNFTTFTKVLHEPVSAVAVSGSTVLAGVRGLGILRSADSGASFVQANNAGLDNLDIVSIAFHPGNSAIVFAAAKPRGNGTTGGVFKSSDSGATWAAFNGNLPEKYVAAVNVDSSGNVYAGILNPGNQGDVYTSSGAAASWTASGDVFGGVASIHRDANAGTTMWVGGRGFGLYTGSGTLFNYAYNQTGTPNLLLSGVNAVLTFPGNASVVLQAIKGAGVWRSTAIATPRAWTRVSFPGTDRVMTATGVAGGGTTTLLAGLYAGGVWRTTNGGTSWNPPIVNGNVQADFSFGASASAVIPFLTIWELSASATNANLVYAAVGGPGMFYTNDSSGTFRYNGSTWSGVFVEAPPNAAPWFGNAEAGLGSSLTNNGFWGPTFGVTVNRANDQIAYASFLAPFHGVVQRNNGPSWSNALPISATPPQVRNVVPSVAANILLAVPFDDKPSLSINSGASWDRIAISQSGFERIRFFSAAENPLSGANWIAGTNKGIFITTNGGTSWSRVTMAGTFQKQVVNAVGFRADGKAFAADYAGNRYCSGNSGATWVSAGSPLRAGVNAIKAIGANIYYLTDGGGMFLQNDPVTPAGC